MHRLVLFDIDCTLIDAHGAGRRAIFRAVQDVYGLHGELHDYSFHGRTDPGIIRDLAAMWAADAQTVSARLPGAGTQPQMVGRLAPRRDERGQEADTLLAACLQRYVELLPEELAAGKIDVLPGVRELLEALAADERVLTGLLTGNIEPGARLKLGAVGLWPYFAVGAFGSDSAHRADLPSIAVARAEALDGRRYAGKQVVVVGDTPADIACGVGMGVRSVAVATGRYSRDELAAHGPDAVLDDFADWRTAFRVIVN